MGSQVVALTKPELSSTGTDKAAPQQPVLSPSSLSNEPHKYNLFIYINLVPSINDDKAIN